MIRSVFIFLMILVLVVVGFNILGDHGSAQALWLGYRVDTSATAAFMIIGILSLGALIFWNLVFWMVQAPQRSAKRALEQRRRQGDEALTRGFMAVANGDGVEARRLSVKALDLCDNVALVRILGAMAAEVSEDIFAAKSAYTAMLSVPELKMAGLKGLLGIAQSQNDQAEAVRLATEAYQQPKPHGWAFRAIFEAKLESTQWGEAQALLDGALSRKLISPIYCERAKAALMTARAYALSESEVNAQRDQALEQAHRAAKLQPQFIPAAVLAAKLYAKSGKAGRAEDILEQSYAVNPHPALWLSYRDLVGDESPKQRAARLLRLVERNPQARESRLIRLESAVIAADKSALSAAIEGLKLDLTDDKLTRRLCGAMARAALMNGHHDEARSWVAKAALLRSEPQWSDLDEKGQAFGFNDGDWAQLISFYAQNGNLIHPRFERGEKILPELPDLPSRFIPSVPFIKAAQKPHGAIPLPDDPGLMDGDEVYAPNFLNPQPEPLLKPKPKPRKSKPTA